MHASRYGMRRMGRWVGEAAVLGIVFFYEGRKAHWKFSRALFFSCLIDRSEGSTTYFTQSRGHIVAKKRICLSPPCKNSLFWGKESSKRGAYLKQTSFLVQTLTGGVARILFFCLLFPEAFPVLRRRSELSVSTMRVGKINLAPELPSPIQCPKKPHSHSTSLRVL